VPASPAVANFFFPPGGRQHRNARLIKDICFPVVGTGPRRDYHHNGRECRAVGGDHGAQPDIYNGAWIAGGPYFAKAPAFGGPIGIFDLSGMAAAVMPGAEARTAQ